MSSGSLRRGSAGKNLTDQMEAGMFFGCEDRRNIYGLVAIVANIRKGTKFLVLYSVQKPCYEG